MRLEELAEIARAKRLDAVLVVGQANIRALTGVNCDNAVVLLVPKTVRGAQTFQITFYTDFRYVPMVHRVAPALKCRDLKKLAFSGKRIGYESSMSHARFLALKKKAPKAMFVDIASDLLLLRAVKTPDEIERLRAAEKLASAIWQDASAQFAAGMTEREMARIIQKMMIDRGEGEAFETIVCVGKNAAECHHEPDDTVWNGRDPVLVDMGVKLGGVCSDLTRNLVPRASRLYKQVYELVLEAHNAAIAAARPGMTAAKLDKIARDVITKGGFGKAFGHSLGHGVGFEIHEAPTVSKRDKTILKPGMTVTIEPGVYLEDNLGVRIEDLVLITEDGCEVLSDALIHTF